MPSLLEAIEMKYGVIEQQLMQCREQQQQQRQRCLDAGAVSIFVPKRSPRVCIPSLLVLNDLDIATAGDGTEIEHKCAGVEELDLAMNKLEEWSEILAIFEHMPRLKFANLSFNTLTSPLDRSVVDQPWNQLRSLVLNSTHIDWRSVRQLVQMLPSLEELHLSFNDYKHVDLNDEEEAEEQRLETCSNVPIDEYCIDLDDEEEEDDSSSSSKDEEENNCGCGGRWVVHEGIKKLHFTGNPITDWSQIVKLGQSFPSLEQLVLADCPIRSLALSRKENPRTPPPHAYFQRLLFLNLNSTAIAEWHEIERIAKFPKLQCLRIQGCPLWESHENTQHERRQFMIARLPNITMLNGGGVISPEEREAAERAFIRHYLDTPDSARPQRYDELVAVHGRLEPLANVDFRPEKRVKVTFTYKERSEVRSVDVYRTVADLKTKLEPLTGLQAARMRLFYVDQDLRHIQGPEEMKYASKQLYSYNIRSGDEIIVDQKKRTHSATST